MATKTQYHSFTNTYPNKESADYAVNYFTAKGLLVTQHGKLVTCSMPVQEEHDVTDEELLDYEAEHLNDYGED